MSRICKHELLLLLFLISSVFPAVAEVKVNEAGFNISETRQLELLNLLKQDCGSCHGMTLKGGLGPALTPESIANKPHNLLVETILAGRPGTPMPPWAPFLSKEEADWLVNNLKKGVWLVP